MTIIEVTKSRDGLYKVVCDEGNSFFLVKETLYEYGLSTGKTVAESDIEEILMHSAEGYAKQKAIAILAHSDSSREGLKKKLAKYVDDESAEAAVDRMEELGLVNDRDYAARLAEHMANVKHFGRRRIIFELQNKGFDRELIEEVCDFPDRDVTEEIRLLLQKKNFDLKDPAGRRKAIDYLTRQGFTWSEMEEAITTDDIE